MAYVDNNQITINKFQGNNNNQNPISKQYNLEERTLEFSKEIVRFCQTLPKNTINFKLIDQLVRSATSIGANYREANETETKKDFLFRIRICRKEAKETVYWLELMGEANKEYYDKLIILIDESRQLLKIFATIGSKVI